MADYICCRSCIEPDCRGCNMYIAVNKAHNEGYDVGYWAGRRDYEPKWIPVTERLPDPKFAREWYLVALESGCVKSLAFEKEGRTDNLFRAGWHETASPVTHWMPLPEPPKEKT